MSGRRSKLPNRARRVCAEESAVIARSLHRLTFVEANQVRTELVGRLVALRRVP